MSSLACSSSSVVPVVLLVRMIPLIRSISDVLTYTSVKNVRVQYAGELDADIGGIEIWFLPSGKSPTSACLIGVNYLLFMPYTRLKPHSCLEESCPMGT